MSTLQDLVVCRPNKEYRKADWSSGLAIHFNPFLQVWQYRDGSHLYSFAKFELTDDNWELANPEPVFKPIREFTVGQIFFIKEQNKPYRYRWLVLPKGRMLCYMEVGKFDWIPASAEEILFSATGGLINE